MAGVRVIYLPPGEGGQKVGLDDFLADSHDVGALLALATDELRPPPGSDARRTKWQAPREEIVVTNRQLREITDDALAALGRANGDQPSYFRRGNVPVRLQSDASSLQVEPLGAAALKGILARCADFLRIENGEMLPARPPNDVVADILALPSLPLPALRGIVDAPVFLPGGRLLHQSGYDATSGLYADLRGLPHLRDDIPLQEALELLLDQLLVDFPFADEASRTHALALLLERFVSALLVGPRPLYLIDAPTQGTGKGLLADLPSRVALGHAAEVMALVRDEDELEKRITSVLLEARPLILLDNVTALRSTSLAAVLTSTVWRGRRLGQSQMVQVPNDASWVATGNNVVLSSEMARRVIPIRLDAKVEHPEERTGFRHPLPSWAIENRNDLVSACLSVVRSWIRAGMPEGAVTLGRFEEWASVMSGILDVAGQPDFLSNRASLRKGADSEHHDWSVLCSFWWDRFAGHPVTASDLFQVAREHGLLLGLWGGRTLLASQQRVGHSLQAHRDRVYGPYIIRTAGQDASTKSNAYRLECHAGEEPDPRNPRDSAWTNGLEPEVSGVSGVSLTPSPGEERVEVDL